MIKEAAIFLHNFDSEQIKLIMLNLDVSITFRESKSKFYSRVLALAGEFSGYQVKEGNNTIVIGLKELFEKWYIFNALFWKVIDWKGTVLKIGDTNFYDHEDKTRMFYALQEARSKLFFFKEEQVKGFYKAYQGDCQIHELDLACMSEEEINRLLDSFLAVKNG